MQIPTVKVQSSVWSLVTTKTFVLIYVCHIDWDSWKLLWALCTFTFKHSPLVMLIKCVWVYLMTPKARVISLCNPFVFVSRPAVLISTKGLPSTSPLQAYALCHMWSGMCVYVWIAEVFHSSPYAYLLHRPSQFKMSI